VAAIKNVCVILAYTPASQGESFVRRGRQLVASEWKSFAVKARQQRVYHRERTWSGFVLESAAVGAMASSGSVSMNRRPGDERKGDKPGIRLPAGKRYFNAQNLAAALSSAS
jgi:hypothetical protein